MNALAHKESYRMQCVDANELPVENPGLSEQYVHNLFQPYLADQDVEWLCLAGFDRWDRLQIFSQHSGLHGNHVCFDTALLRSLLASPTVKNAIVAHNHPSGNPTPSVHDIAATSRLAMTCDMLGIHLVDHFVFAGENWFSFRQAGLI